jgi:hypothetical protein
VLQAIPIDAPLFITLVDQREGVRASVIHSIAFGRYQGQWRLLEAKIRDGPPLSTRSALSTSLPKGPNGGGPSPSPSLRSGGRTIRCSASAAREELPSLIRRSQIKLADR